MANEAIGRLLCPICGQGATVHQNKRADRLRYIRCGEVSRGVSSGCGTLQCYGATGQRWIADNLQPLANNPLGSQPAPEPEPDPSPVEPEPAVEPERVQPVPKPAPQPQSAPEPARRGIWARIIDGATGEL